MMARSKTKLWFCQNKLFKEHSVCFKKCNNDIAGDNVKAAKGIGESVVVV